MIMPSDKEYLQTKRLKKEGIKLTSPFKELADWIANTYHVVVLNIYYDTVKPDNRPRLSVAFEFEAEALKFRDGGHFNFDAARQNAVKEQFLILLAQQDDCRFKTDGLFIIFVAFEPVARIEANHRVTKGDINSLKSKLTNANLWEIAHAFDGVVFFFYTDAQAKEAEAKGLKDYYAQEYARLLAPYDEFGYLKRRGIQLQFDSKENFDTNYQSNWFYYYR